MGFKNYLHIAKVKNKFLVLPAIHGVNNMT